MAHRSQRQNRSGCNIPLKSKHWSFKNHTFKNYRKMKNKFLAEWVSVNERLPKNTNEVPIKDENYNDTLGIGSYREKDGWAISGNNYWRPTHWLELKPVIEGVV